MTECEYCGSNVGLPFICKYCGASLCVNHRLPETHDCPNLFRAMPPKPLFTRPLLRQVPRYKRGTKSFMTREVRDILVAWITLSFCSSIAYLFRPSLFPSYFGVSLATLGLGFIVHELTHRSLARKYGCTAEFKAWPMGLIMALIFALISAGRIIFAAPGAVYIGPKTIGYEGITKKEIGLISLGGPLSNALIGIGFLGLSPFQGIIGLIGTIGFRVNIWLSAFNLLPSGMMDGHKILSWSPKIWAASAIPIWAITIVSLLH